MRDVLRAGNAAPFSPRNSAQDAPDLIPRSALNMVAYSGQLNWKFQPVVVQGGGSARRFPFTDREPRLLLREQNPIWAWHDSRIEIPVYLNAPIASRIRAQNREIRLMELASEEVKIIIVSFFTLV